MRFHTVESESKFLRNAARETFAAVLQAVDARRAVKNAVCLADDNLRIGDEIYELPNDAPVFSVALGKAALPMARGLSESLGANLRGGVISCPPSNAEAILDVGVWQIFHGGHPLPNEASLAAAKAAFELLRKVSDAPDAIVIFLVSGGGSVMLELPSDGSITLAELQAANRALVTCGATIAEINALRRRFSKVKGGGLSRAARRAKQITLVVSDTNDGEIYNVASGPTVAPENEFESDELREIIARYELQKKLPQKIFECLKNSLSEKKDEGRRTKDEGQIFTLLGNGDAVRAARDFLRERDFVVEMANDLVETPIETGCAELVERLLKLRETTPREKSVALISGGEFVCPVRGDGRGGRNTESALWTVILFDELKKSERWKNAKFAALYAGTDGIDGNSPAAGATADDATLDRARELNLNHTKFLETSDSYGFFRALDDAIETGATGTNVRDIRILLA